MSIGVFIADDHGILRGGLRALIGAQPDMVVLGEAATGPDAESGVKETEPDVVLMDISMPGGGGLAAIAAIKRVRPKTRILVLTVHDELGYVRAAADAGAIGYVVKNAVDTELLAAIRAIAQGRTFMDVPLSMGLAPHSLLRKRSEVPGGRAAPQLTPREREVMARVAEGFTNSQIAQELGLGIKSVETYRARVMDKLGLTSRSDLVRFALESGVLAPGKPA
jgi:two-component system, NarL family, response regulator NreC